MRKLLAIAALSIGLSFSLAALAQQNPVCQSPWENNCTQPPSCGNPGAPTCHPTGNPICTAIGCYQMSCNEFGCALVFTPANPFKPRMQEN